MSRNLSMTGCHQCGGAVVQEEEPRPITLEECEPYKHYALEDGLVVANASCEDCGAKYLAWVAIDRAPSADSPYPFKNDAREHEWQVPNRRHFDLSYRHSFNDEPADEDLPTKKPSLARALRELKYLPDDITADECIEVAEAWMERAVALRKMGR